MPENPLTYGVYLQVCNCMVSLKNQQVLKSELKNQMQRSFWNACPKGRESGQKDIFPVLRISEPGWLFAFQRARTKDKIPVLLLEGEFNSRLFVFLPHGQGTLKINKDFIVNESWLWPEGRWGGQGEMGLDRRNGKWEMENYSFSIHFRSGDGGGATLRNLIKTVPFEVHPHKVVCVCLIVCRPSATPPLGRPPTVDGHPHVLQAKHFAGYGYN